MPRGISLPSSACLPGTSALAACERAGGAAAELCIVIDDRDTIHVVDALDSDAETKNEAPERLR